MSKTLRPAEDIAREMVSPIDVMMSMAGPHIYHFAIGDLRCSYEDQDVAVAQHKVAVTSIASAIERGRAAGGAAERERFNPLVRAAQRWAAEARKTVGPAEAQLAADLDLVEAVEAFDAASGATQPRDLAGRIRALYMKYAARSIDSSAAALRDGNDEEAYAPSSVVVDVLCAAYLDACAGIDLGFRIRRMRGGPTCSTETRAELDRAADELEAIVREAGEQR